MLEKVAVPKSDWNASPNAHCAEDARAQTTVVEEGAESAPRSVRALRLHVVHSPGESLNTSSHLTVETTLSVGRDVGSAQLCIDDPRMSRLHFRIVFDHRQGMHRIGDAGSSNGTFLNGQRIDSSVVNAGDVIRAGSTLFVIEDTADISRAREQLKRVAATELRVLLTGETGVGKEVFAKRLHEASGRGGPFVAVNCAALSRELAGAELFGHRRGAFSGASGQRAGLFVTADQGTLLLDELGELSLDLQAMLLRTLEENKVRPVGSDTEIPVNVRLIAATNVPVEKLAKGDGFRTDLFARLAQVRIQVPPLRQRRTEILELIQTFASEHKRKLNLTVDAAEELLLWSWPYNIRELKSCVAGLVTLYDSSKVIDSRVIARDFPHMARPVTDRIAAATGESQAPPKRGEVNPLANRQQLSSLLEKFEGNVTAVARHLGVERSQVYRWMKRLGMER